MRWILRTRFGRPLAVALLVLVMAVTPLSAFLSGGVFEAWLPGDEFVSPTRVSLNDSTRLVRGMAAVYSAPDGVTNPGGNLRILIVSWTGGCADPWTTLSFSSAGDGYRIVETTESHCFLNIGVGRAVAISLWTPVDASTVEFVSDD